MAVTLHRWESKITIETGNWTADLTEYYGASPETPATITLTAAKTYYHSSAGNDTVDLGAKLGALLTAASAGGSTYVVNLGASTGRYTIAGGGGGLVSFNITWDEDGLRDVLGFTADDDLSGSTSYTSSGAAQGLWLPDGYYLGLTSIDDPLDRSDSTVTQSPSGAYFHRLQYNRKSIITGGKYQACTRARARIAGESFTSESWQQFWRDVIDGDLSAYLEMGHVRIYPDVATDGTYYDYWVGKSEGCDPSSLKEGWQGLFDIPIPELTLG